MAIGHQSIAIVLLLAIAPACGATPGGPSPPSAPNTYAAAHFRIAYTTQDASAVATIAAGADAEAPRILAELGMTGMPEVRVTYYETHAAMADAVRPLVGAIPSFASGLVTSARDIHLVWVLPASPDALRLASTRLAHEFAHCVTLQRNPSSANNPRWLWETLAVYTARDRADPSRLAAVLAGSRPTVAQLNSFDTTLVYDVAFSLGEFIVEQRGLDGLRALMLSNGGTTMVFGLSTEEFLDGWFAWARARLGDEIYSP
jgi:hypothetical protein